MRAGLVAQFAAAVEHERTEQLALMGTEDFQRGHRRVARRAGEPRFTGR